MRGHFLQFSILITGLPGTFCAVPGCWSRPKTPLTVKNVLIEDPILQSAAIFCNSTLVTGLPGARTLVLPPRPLTAKNVPGETPFSSTKIHAGNRWRSAQSSRVLAGQFGMPKWGITRKETFNQTLRSILEYMLTTRIASTNVPLCTFGCTFSAAIH